MIFIYNILIFLVKIGLPIAARFNPKARLWLDGRKDIFKNIENKIEDIHLKNENPSHPLSIKRFWIHVASLGEFEQGRPIIEAIKNENPQHQIILTFFSPSGYELRKNYPLADGVFYLPIDTAHNAQRFLDIVQPDIAIFVKYEFWYHYLHTLKKRAIPTLLVSGIFREKQFAWWSPYSYFFKKMLTCFTHLFVQNTPSVFLLKKHGFENVTLAGDTRIDRVRHIPTEGKRFDLIEKFVGNAPVLVCGSTWEADENVILPLLNDAEFQRWAYIFAPHDIAKSNLDRLVKSLPSHAVLYSDIEKNSFKNSNINPKILIIDNVGMLSALYRYGRIAYIGGGFGKGIHNTLEPIAFGLPVLFGTKYSKFEEANRLIETGGAFSISNYEQFKARLLWLKYMQNYDNASASATRYIVENQGATERIMKKIQEI
jgi:3-deoxy-D-manno-octulosonic-acid transferase